MFPKIISISSKNVIREKYQQLHTMACEIVADMLNANRPFDDVNITGEIEIYLRPNIVFYKSPEYAVITENTKDMLQSVVPVLWAEVQALNTPEKIKRIAKEVIYYNNKVKDVDFETDIDAVLKKYVNGVYASAKNSSYFQDFIKAIKTEIVKQIHPVNIIYPQETINKNVSELFSTIEGYKGLNKVSAGLATLGVTVSVWQLPGVITNAFAIKDWATLIKFVEKDTIGAIATTALVFFVITRTLTFIRTMGSILGKGKELLKLYVHPKNFENYLAAINTKSGSTRTTLKQFVRYSLYKDVTTFNHLAELIMDTKMALQFDLENKDKRAVALALMKEFQQALKTLQSKTPKGHVLYTLLQQAPVKPTIAQLQEYLEKLAVVVEEEVLRVNQRVALFAEALEYPEDNALKVHNNVLSLIISGIGFMIKSKPQQSLVTVSPKK